MKFLVVGKDGRASALIAAVAKSPLVTELFCAPGNAGVVRERLLSNNRAVRCVPIAETDSIGLRNFAKEKKIDLTVFGSRLSLVLGTVTLFEVAGLKAFGPGNVAARFEGSKCFFQDFARRHKLPVASGESFNNPVEAKAYTRTRSLGGRCVVKPDRDLSGHAVCVCHSVAEADAAIEHLFFESAIGPSDNWIVIQELLEGFEVSLQILCDGNTWKLLPAARDYKLLNGFQTGGMGSYSPHSHLSDGEVRSLAEAVMGPFLKGCRAEGIVYKGLLFPGMMVTNAGGKILESNVGFGDPEIQAVVPRIKTDLAELLLATTEGRLAGVELEIHENRSTVCVVIAAPGYPDTSKLVIGKKITGLEALSDVANLKIFHAGTRFEDSDLVSSHGRILSVTAWNDNKDLAFALDCARHSAYCATSSIKIEGGFQMLNNVAEPAISL